MEVIALGNFLEGLSSYASVAEAAAALGMTGTEGAGFAGVAYTVAGGAAQATTSTAGLTEIINLAQAANLEASGIGVATSGIGLLEGGVGSYDVAALLGVSSPIVAAAVAPILGVSLGALLYEENPSLWTKISMTLLPFCYEGTDKIPTWAEVVDDSWVISISKSVIDAIKGLFQNEGVPLGNYVITDYEVAEGVTIVGGTVFAAPHTYQGTTYGTGAQYFAWINNYKGIAFSDSPFANSNQSASEPYYYYREYSYPIRLTDPTFNVNDSNGIPHLAASIRAILGLTEPSPVSSTYPPGTSKWGGTTPTEIPMSKPAVVSPGGATQPMVPISLPYEVPEISPGQNVPSPDPEEQPDPTVTDDPEKQVDPYIMPYPVPWEVINPSPELDPEADPSQEPARPEETPDIPETVLPDIVPFGLSPIPLMPDTPLPFASNVGLVTVYHPTPAQLYAFEAWLWVTLANADINTVWNNPFDGVITLFELYCTPTDVGNRTIHSGFLDSGVNSAVISRYTEINCGTIGIPEYYGNYFDYSPYSKAHIYLPFIGVQELNVDDIVGHVVNVTYRIDEYNGSCIAMITVSKSTEVNGTPVDYRNTMYQFSGNCSVELPIAGGSQAAIKAGMMQADAYQHAANVSAGASLLGGVASIFGTTGIMGLISGITNAASQYTYGQANALSHMLSGKSTVQKSGSFGASHGALGIKTPFITITRPKQIQVPNYNDLYGYPAHKSVMINSCTGFLRCREVHVISATASEAEKSVIESMLKSGVYVTE